MKKMERGRDRHTHRETDRRTERDIDKGRGREEGLETQSKRSM